MIKQKKALILSLVFISILVLSLQIAFAVSYGSCGDGIIQGGEECDYGSLSIIPSCTGPGGACNDMYGKCNTNCTKNICGNNKIEMPNFNGIDEECDGTDMDGMTYCTDFSPPLNNVYGSELLSCNPPGNENECVYNYSNCKYCGDGVCDPLSESYSNCPEDCSDDLGDDCTYDGISGTILPVSGNTCEKCIYDVEQSIWVVEELPKMEKVPCTFSDTTTMCVCIPEDADTDYLYRLFRQFIFFS